MNCFNQCWGLFIKNTLYFRRNWFCSIVEILIPIVFTFFLGWIRSLVDIETIPEQSYLKFSIPLYGNSPFVNVSEYNTSKMQDYFGDMSLLYSKKTFQFKNCDDRGGGNIALIPKNSLTTQLEAYLKEVVPYEVVYFDSNDELDTYVKQEGYYENEDIPSVCMAIAIIKDEKGDWDYLIRYNMTGRPSNVDLPDPTLNMTNDFRKEWMNETLVKYISSGFLQIQNWIDNLILRQETNDENAIIFPFVTSMKVPEHDVDNILSTLQGTLGIFILFPMLFPYLRFAYALIQEKEKRIKENMRNMGMGLTPYFISWIAYYMIIFFIIAIFWALFAKLLFFKKSNYISIFFYHYTYGLLLLSLTLLITSFFSKAKAGVLTSLVIYFLCYIGNILLQNSSNPTSMIKNLATLSPMTGVDIAGSSILFLESIGEGLNSENVRKVANNYVVLTYFIIAWLEILIFSSLGIYFDQIVKLEYGRRKHCCFCCMVREPKNHDKALLKTAEQVNGDNYEKANANVNLNENSTLDLSGVHFKYPNGKIAVENLYLRMYSDQIFSFLGHNGAGKTTTISMISGLLTPTEGCIKILGNDMVNDSSKIEKILGVCPQTNPLFDYMTVAEHLELYGRIKGMKIKKVKEEAKDLIHDLELNEKKNYLSKNLSGGQKRKLCVAMAFIGGSKVILFDEPTSGMDTYARRKLWEMLKNYKKGRIIILTTHYMDEADFLGDRIGIMGDGKLMCCGSSLYLKSKFGVGYSLTFVMKNPNSPMEKIKDLVIQSVPGAKSLNNKEFEYQLPMESSSHFAALFNKLDSCLDELGISSYGVSVTTLEEVFLKVANGVAEGRNNKKIMDSTTINDEHNALIDNSVMDYDLESIRVKSPIKIFLMHFYALFKKRIIYFRHDIKGVFCEVIVPILIIIIGLALMLIDFNPEPEWINIAPDLFIQDESVSVVINAIQNDGQSVPSNISTYFNENLEFYQVKANDYEEFDDYLMENPEYSYKRPFSSYFLHVDKEKNIYAYILFVNTTALASSPFGLYEVNKGIISYASNNAKLVLNVTSAPLPQTLSTLAIENTADSFVATILFSLAVSFIPASLIVIIVKERELNIKHQQIVSGVSLFGYWAANFAADLLKYMPVGIISPLMCLAFGIDAFTEGDAMGMTFCLFIFYGSCMIGFVYCFSFLFKNPSSAQVAIFIVFYAFGFIGVIAIFILYLIDSTHDAAKVLMYFFRFIPSFSFGYGLIEIGNKNIFRIREGYTEEFGSFSKNIALADFLYILLFSFGYFGLVFVIEKLITIPGLIRLITREDKIKQKVIEKKDIDHDVVEEAERIKGNSNEYAVKLENARKVYTISSKIHKVAVDNVSFGVQNGECFALLGVNGAGKTTTFKILSGEVPTSSGKAYIQGYDLSKDMNKVRHVIGYCPQFDALLENLTAKQHLEMYAAIKGIPNHISKKLVQEIILKMDLKRFENVKAGTYSGGNKRKLSVAMALIGNPAVIFLDEPSSGMDPEARRFMWEVIENITTKKKKCSVILTTHSMEEADRLSNRMVIMVDGNIKCIGSGQHIKNKYGDGYEVEFKCSDPTETEIGYYLSERGIKIDHKVTKDNLQESLSLIGFPYHINNISEYGTASAVHFRLKDAKHISIDYLVESCLIEQIISKIHDFVAQKIGESVIIERYGSFVKYKIINKINLGEVFKAVEDNKADLKITQYSVKQTTIEQIFNHFAKNSQFANVQ